MLLFQCEQGEVTCDEVPSHDQRDGWNGCSAVKENNQKWLDMCNETIELTA